MVVSRVQFNTQRYKAGILFHNGVLLCTYQLLLSLIFFQVFHRFDVQSVAQTTDGRFDFFIKKILPQYKDAVTSHVLIYIPSYFDYVRLRNYFKKEGLNFVQICEYSKVKGSMNEYVNSCHWLGSG
jgi:U3 small nucleolar RNA-associated protein 25